MKFLHLTFHFEYSDPMERMLDKHGVTDFVRYPMIEGKDCDGKHFGTQVYPGNVAVIQALVEEESLSDLLDELRAFRDEKRTRHHLRAVVLAVDDHF
ncbi:MAG: hypothetical protein K9N51_13805 [Candidatus Pacebacteria bacterium]|nr:hypothetical protein [Candidatus Paceibacterota bacterium]